MYGSLETIIFLTSCILLSASEKVEKLHSLVGPFTAGNAYLPYWDLTGSSEMKVDFISLTSDEPSKRGAIWNNYVSEMRDWEFQMSFRIHGRGAKLNGDGMAIWYAREPLVLGPVFGSKDYFSGLAVFIDSYKNYDDLEDVNNEYNYPYISVMVNNGTLHYNNALDGVYTMIGGCHAKIRNLEHPTKIAVSYIRSVLMVFLDADGLGVWKQCFRSPGIHMPTGYYFGISASTGELSDNHDIYSINVLDMTSPDVEKEEDRSGIVPEAEYFVLPKEYKDEKDEAKQPDEIEDALQETSILKKFLYTAGIATILSVVTVLCKKYWEQRKIKMEKRLY